MSTDSTSPMTADAVDQYVVRLRKAMFTEALPTDAGPDDPATENRTLESIPGHREPLEVQAVLEANTAPIFHIGHAVLDHATARELVDHLSELLAVTEGMPAPVEHSPEDTEPEGQHTDPESVLDGYLFPRTRKWRGEQVPASGVHLYRTVDHRDVVEVEYVATPEGPVVLVDGRRPISLDDTHTLMQDMALYRRATGSGVTAEQEVPC